MRYGDCLGPIGPYEFDMMTSGSGGVQDPQATLERFMEMAKRAAAQRKTRKDKPVAAWAKAVAATARQQPDHLVEHILRKLEEKQKKKA